MNKFKVSSRLMLIVVLAALIMGGLAAINWVMLRQLSELHDIALSKADAAGHVRNEANLGAQAYRVIADTYINRNFDEAEKKWSAINTDIDKSLAYTSSVADTEKTRSSLAAASHAMERIRSIYTQQFLDLTRRDASRLDIAGADEAIDNQIDKFDTAYSEIAEALSQEAAVLSKEFDQAAEKTRWLVLASILAGAAVLIALTVVISRSITQQLGMELSDATALAHRIAQGDLTHPLKTESTHPGSLANALGNMLATLQEIVVNVRQGAQSVAEASAEIAQGNQDLSGRTEQQAGALEQTAASMADLGSTVRQNAASAGNANQLAQRTSKIAVQCGEIVNRVVETMDGIEDSSKKIGDIISVIDGIAFQTNILALNAAVEAARAGEQGRGFAVVASEVRSLAGRSAAAAKEISNLISASVSRVQDGTHLVGQAGQTMSEVVDSIQEVTAIMGNISAASIEQASGVSQVSEAISHMDNATQQNAAMVEQMTAAAASLRAQAQELVGLVATFNVSNTPLALALVTRGPAP